ncbi:MAG TPA: hypothetical protein VKP69_33305, partial [Isosphaeraceae bacterium]|nr:hypothetical protein [Isosphaeraceae bacterium]
METAIVPDGPALVYAARLSGSSGGSCGKYRPEYGKAKFLSHLEAEIGRAKAKCPDAHYVGIADGAQGNW